MCDNQPPASKMTIMIFGSIHTLSCINKPEVRIGHKIIVVAVGRFKYFGTVLGRNYISGNLLTRRDKDWQQIKDTFESFETSLLLYKTIIIPVFDHADIVYDCLSAQESNRIQMIGNVGSENDLAGRLQNAYQESSQ